MIPTNLLETLDGGVAADLWVAERLQNRFPPINGQSFAKVDRIAWRVVIRHYEIVRRYQGHTLHQ